MVEEQAVDQVVALLQHNMGSWRVSYRRGLAACACIGSGFTDDPMSPARAITARARERIPVITQGASDTGIILMVEESESERALRRLPLVLGWMAKRPIPHEVTDAWLRPLLTQREIRRDLIKYLRAANKGDMLAAASCLRSFDCERSKYGC